jgi:hypothetical protein
LAHFKEAQRLLRETYRIYASFNKPENPDLLNLISIKNLLTKGIFGPMSGLFAPFWMLKIEKNP